MSTQSTQSVPGDLACILTIHPIQDNVSKSYRFDAIVYDGNGGTLRPKLLIADGKIATITLQMPSTQNFTYYSNSFGPISCQAAPGLHLQVITQKAAENNSVEVNLFVLLQYAPSAKITMRTLDISCLKITPGQSILLQQQANGVIAIPIDMNSPASIKNAKTLSPTFAAHRSSLPDAVR